MDRIVPTMRLCKGGDYVIVNQADAEVWLADGWKTADKVESKPEAEEPIVEEKAAAPRRRRAPKADNPFEI